MGLYVGTSGFSYKPWKGSFYPKDLPDKQMLRFYGECFPSVEINSTFYRMPKATVLETWAGSVPDQFQFVIKAPKLITHIRKLGEVDEHLSRLLETAEALSGRLGPLLFQLPPTLKIAPEKLRTFLKLLPTTVRAAFEFRHASWYVDEVYDILREQGAALCVADIDDELDIPFVSTADWGYLRLRRPDYDDAGLQEWVDRVREQGWRDAFIFFKHEDEGKGPRMARRYLELAASA
ncbi:DUF72 domain-containing protein [Singulisphaera rosea]